MFKIVAVNVPQLKGKPILARLGLKQERKEDRLIRLGVSGIQDLRIECYEFYPGGRFRGGFHEKGVIRVSIEPVLLAHKERFNVGGRQAASFFQKTKEYNVSIGILWQAEIRRLEVGSSAPFHDAFVKYSNEREAGFKLPNGVYWVKEILSRLAAGDVIADCVISKLNLDYNTPLNLLTVCDCLKNEHQSLSNDLTFLPHYRDSLVAYIIDEFKTILDKVSVYLPSIEASYTRNSKRFEIQKVDPAASIRDFLDGQLKNVHRDLIEFKTLRQERAFWLIESDYLHNDHLFREDFTYPWGLLPQNYHMHLSKHNEDLERKISSYNRFSDWMTPHVNTFLDSLDLPAVKKGVVRTFFTTSSVAFDPRERLFFDRFANWTLERADRYLKLGVDPKRIAIAEEIFINVFWEGRNQGRFDVQPPLFLDQRSVEQYIKDVETTGDIKISACCMMAKDTTVKSTHFYDYKDFIQKKKNNWMRTYLKRYIRKLSEEDLKDWCAGELYDMHYRSRAGNDVLHTEFSDEAMTAATVDILEQWMKIPLTKAGRELMSSHPPLEMLIAEKLKAVRFEPGISLDAVVKFSLTWVTYRSLKNIGEAQLITFYKESVFLDRLKNDPTLQSIDSYEITGTAYWAATNNIRLEPKESNMSLIEQYRSHIQARFEREKREQEAADAAFRAANPPQGTDEWYRKNGYRLCPTGFNSDGDPTGTIWVAPGHPGPDLRGYAFMFTPGYMS